MSDACDLLVTGAKGQLGRAVLELAAARGLKAVGVDVQEMPLDDRASVQRGVAAARPRFVLHCGAITNVDGCEVLSRHVPKDAEEIEALMAAA